MTDKLFIAAFFKQTGLKKPNLATFVGVNQSTISHFETGWLNLLPDALATSTPINKKTYKIF
jgi:DNA-binding XRE family transcriptional regulator